VRRIALPIWSGVSTPVAPSSQILQVGFDQSQFLAKLLNLKVPCPCQDGTDHHHGEQSSHSRPGLDQVKTGMKGTGRRRRADTCKLGSQQGNHCAAGDSGVQAARNQQVAFSSRDHEFHQTRGIQNDRIGATASGAPVPDYAACQTKNPDHTQRAVGRDASRGLLKDYASYLATEPAQRLAEYSLVRNFSLNRSLTE